MCLEAHVRGQGWLYPYYGREMQVRALCTLPTLTIHYHQNHFRGSPSSLLHCRALLIARHTPLQGLHVSPMAVSDAKAP